MKKILAALLALPLLGLPALAGAASAQTAPAGSVTAAPVQLQVTPTSIRKGQNTLAQANARAGETIALYGRPNATTPWKLIRSSTTANGYKGWVLAPGNTTDFFARPIGAPQSRNSAIVTVKVAAPAVPACSSTSIRTSHADSAHCLISAHKRSDWAAVSNYALPPVVAELKDWRSQPHYNIRFSFSGCGFDRGYASTSSSGVHCQFYWHPDPDEDVHGTAVQFGMDRYFRAETVETFG